MLRLPIFFSTFFFDFFFRCVCTRGTFHQVFFCFVFVLYCSPKKQFALKKDECILLRLMYRSNLFENIVLVTSH